MIKTPKNAMPTNPEGHAFKRAEKTPRQRTRKGTPSGVPKRRHAAGVTVLPKAGF
jgi:hypothetical protein